MLYEYGPITAGLDYLLYLLKKDNAGNLLGNGIDLGERLVALNNELLKIIKTEITEYEELRKACTDQSIKTYYMLLEKKHNYLNPIYEASIATIYNQPLKTEKERLETTKPTAKPLNEPNESITDFIKKLMPTKETLSRPNLLKDDLYIYKVFPKSEARLKSVRASMSFLCEEFLKVLNNKEWASRIMTPEQRNIHNDQRYKYMILIFRFLQRDEKCLSKKAMNCLDVLFKQRNDKEEVFPDKISRECLTSSFINRISDTNEYKKLIRIMKIFPKAFTKNFWERISNSFKTILVNLNDSSKHRAENPKIKHNTEFHMACFLIKSYKHKYYRDDDMSVFKLNIDRVIELQQLFYVFNFSDAILKNPLADLFNRFADVAIKYIEELNNNESKTPGAPEKNLCTLLKMVASVLKSKKAVKFRDTMQKESPSILMSILEYNYRNIEKYDVIHEVLCIAHELNKRNKTWLKDQRNLMSAITKVWQSFMPNIETIQKRIWYLLGDFMMVIKLHVAYLMLCPIDVEAAYQLLEFLKHPEHICIHELRQFFWYDLREIIPAEAYKAYVEKYLLMLKGVAVDEKLCSDATNYLMIPLLFNFYKKQVNEVALDKSLEEMLLKTIFSVQSWRPIVQRRLLRLGVFILNHINKERVEESKRVVVMDIWKKLKSEDYGMKVWAFLALAKFANKVLMPNERIQEVVHAFFGENHGDYVDIVSTAIDNFIPVMFKHKSQGNQFEQNLFLLEKTIRINAASTVSLSNIFGMVVRDQAVFRAYKHNLYPRMIHAFQKIFFYSKQHSSKTLALNLAEVMLDWSTDENQEKRAKEMETQIRDILATCIFKELYQLHYIFDLEDSTDKDCIELTYKCLVILRKILKISNNQELKFIVNDKRITSHGNRETSLHLSIINIVLVIMTYYNKKKVEENIPRFIEAIQGTLRCKWPGKSELTSPQKLPYIIEALCRFCSLLKKLVPEYPAQWKECLTKVFEQDLEIFFNEIKNFDKTAQQNRDENKTGTQERIQIKSYQEQIYYLIPHLTIRLCAIHNKLGIPILTETTGRLFECWNYMCKVFIKYLRLCDKFQIYPFLRGSSAITTQQNTANKEQSGWEWLAKDDPDIVLMGTEIFKMDFYIRDTIIQMTHYLADKVIEQPKYAHRFFDILINVFEKDCIDEYVLIEIVKDARKVIMSKVKIAMSIDQTQPSSHPYPSQGNRSKLIGRLQERMQNTYELASNELLELTYDYLKSVSNIKDHHRKILFYTLLQLKNKSLIIRNKFFSLFDLYYGKSVYKRLQYIFLQQILDYSKDYRESFWIQQNLDLLLSSIDEEAPMQREPGGVVLLAFHGKQPANEAMTDTVPEELAKIIDTNEKAAKKLKTKKTKYWLRPLRDVTNWEYHICEKLWLKLFPQFWNVMSADEQQQIAGLIEPFLTRDEFLKQMQGKRPNAIRTMFEAVCACDPLPKFSPESIQFLGKNYGAWHTALPLLESYLYAYPGNERYYISMNIILKNLAENDYVLGLQRYISKSSVTHAAISYGQFQMWNSLDDLLSVQIVKNVKLEDDLIKEEESEDLDINKLLKQVDSQIWEEWKIEAALNLNQWEILKGFAANTQKTSLTLQCYWSTNEWANFTDISKRAGNSEVPMSLLAQLYERIQQGNDNDTERETIYKRGLKAFFAEWNMLPNIVDLPHYQSIIIQEHFLETNEHKNMCKDLNDYMQKQSDPDFKSPLSNWRERLPNKCEPFTVWRDLLGCRNFLFNQLKSKFVNNLSLTRFEVNIHDIPWNHLKLAEIARKHGLVDQALYYLAEADKFIKDAGEVHNYEKFLFAKETAKLALQFNNSEWDETIDYLKSVEKQSYCKKSTIALSEIMRLRGELLYKVNKTRDAYDELNSAVNECLHNYKAWESYAMICEAQYAIKKDSDSNSHALKGYIHAAIYMLSRSKYYIPRVLMCLERGGSESSVADNDSSNSTMKLFKEYIINLPTWVWLYWLPQLFSNLSHSPTEREAALIVLKNIAKLYSQPLFLYVKRLQKKVSSPVLTGQMIADTNDLLSKLKEREQEGETLDYIERMLDDLERKVLISANKENELLFYLKQLYYSFIPVASAKVFIDQMKQLYERFFAVVKEEYLDLQNLYKENFSKDFLDPQLETKPVTEPLEKVRNWIDYLHTKVILRTEQQSIDRYSQDLANYMPRFIEMFGVNYQKDTEPTPESTIYITRVETKVEKTHLKTRVDLRGTNEKTYNYYLQSYDDNEYNEILIRQLRIYLNKIFSTNRHTNVRNVRLYSPYSLYWGNMKITLDEQHIMPMGDLHDAAMIERGLHPDHAFISYFTRIAKIKPNQTEETISKKVIREMENLLGEFIFAGFIHKLVSNPDELFIYKKQFTNSLAAQAFFSYAFRIDYNDFTTLMFCKRTGKIHARKYNQKLIGIEEEKASPVPFRLTPNLQYFITPIGIEGPFAGTITAAALALQGKKLQFLKDYLHFYYRNTLENYPDGKEKIEANFKKTIDLIGGMLDMETASKVFNDRYVYIKTEDGKMEDPNKDKQSETVCFNREVYQKIDEAKDPEQLRKMPLIWAPWFQLVIILVLFQQVDIGISDAYLTQCFI